MTKRVRTPDHRLAQGENRSATGGRDPMSPGPAAQPSARRCEPSIATSYSRAPGRMAPMRRHG